MKTAFGQRPHGTLSALSVFSGPVHKWRGDNQVHLFLVGEASGHQLLRAFGACRDAYDDGVEVALED
jgi:hypothetical protein